MSTKIKLIFFLICGAFIGAGFYVFEKRFLDPARGSLTEKNNSLNSKKNNTGNNSLALNEGVEEGILEPSRVLRSELASRLLEKFQVDPDSFLDEIVNLDDRTVRIEIMIGLSSLLDDLSLNEIEEILGKLNVDKLNSSGAGEWLGEEILKRVVLINPVLVENWIGDSNFPGYFTKSIHGALISERLKESTESAAIYVEGFPLGSFQDSAWITLVRSIAKDSFDDALLLVEQLPEGSLNRRAVRALVQTVLAEDVGNLEELRAKFPDHEDEMIQLAVEILKDEDPVQAFDLNDDLPSNLAYYGKVTVMYSWMEADPHGCLEKIGFSSDNENLMRETVGFWATRDPSAAGEYIEKLESFSSNETELEFKYSVAREMSKLEPEKLLPWLEGLEDSVISDSLWNRVSFLGDLDSASKVSAASRIKDKKKRLNALTRTIEEIQGNKKKKAAINNLILSSLEKKFLMDEFSFSSSLDGELR